MGGSSSSSSTTSQKNTAINPNAFADHGGTAVTTATNGDGNYTVNNVTTLDAGLAAHGYDTLLNFGQDALLFGSVAQKDSYKFSADTVKQSFDFAGKSLDKTLDFSTKQSDKTLAFAQHENDQTLAFATQQTAAANQQTAAAFTSANDAYKKALDFSGHQTGQALDALAGSAKLIDGAYKDAKGVLGKEVIMVAMFAGVAIIYFALKHK